MFLRPTTLLEKCQCLYFTPLFSLAHPCVSCLSHESSLLFCWFSLYIYYTMTLCYFRQKQALGVQNPCTQSKKNTLFCEDGVLFKKAIPIATKNNFSKKDLLARRDENERNEKESVCRTLMFKHTLSSSIHITERGDKTASALLFICAEHLLAVHFDTKRPLVRVEALRCTRFFEEFYMPAPAVFVSTLSFFSKFHPVMFLNFFQGSVAI